MNIENIFNQIKQKYEELGHKLSWSFLTTSKNTLINNSSIALITLNPGGHVYTKPVESFEKGNAYMHEDWNGKGEGKEPLQRQIQYLFKELVIRHPGYNDYEQLMNETLMGYYIPIRSPSIDDLHNYDESRNFAYALWSDILQSVEVSLIICIDKHTYQDIKNILSNLCDAVLTEDIPFFTGWGNVKAEIKRFEKTGKTLTIARLPHLSGFKIFNRKKSQEYVDKIVEEMMREFNLSSCN